jgi:hypothetical protein
MDKITKWNIGDECYFIHEGIPYKGKINKILIIGTNTSNTEYLNHEINAVYTDGIKSINYAYCINPFRSINEMLKYIKLKLKKQEEVIRERGIK